MVTKVSANMVQFMADAVSPDNFGAVGDGTTNDAAAFASCITTGKPIALTPGKNYRIDTEQLFTDRDCIMFCLGGRATITQGANVTPIRVLLNFQDVRTVTAISATTTDFSNGTGASTEMQALTVSGVLNNYITGTLAKIVSDDKHSSADPANNERIGEFFRVSSVSGSTVNTTSLFFEDYATNVATNNCRIGRMQTDKRVYLENIDFAVHSSALASWNAPLLQVEGAYQPQLRDLRSEGAQAAFVQLVGCYGVYTSNLRVANLRTSLANSAYGYGIIELSCFNSRHEGLQGRWLRHLYATGVYATTTNQSNLTRFGRTMHATISGGRAFNCYGPAFETHPDAAFVTFSDCIVFEPVIGESADACGFALRGFKNRVADCTVYGGRGFLAFKDYAAANNSIGHIFSNCRHIHSAASTSTSLWSFYVRGITGSNCTDIVIDNPYSEASRTNSPVFWFVRGEARMMGGFVDANVGANNKIFDLNNGSVVRGSGMVIDYSKTAVANVYTAKLRNASDVFEWTGMEVRKGSGGVGWVAPLDFTSVAASGKMFNLKYDSRFSDADGKVNDGGSPTFALTLDDSVGILTGSATYDPASLADGAGDTTTVTVTGAVLGDFVSYVSHSINVNGITVTAWVSAANTVSVRFQNESGGPLDIASGTLRVAVKKAWF